MRPLQIVPDNAQHIGSRREQQDTFAFSDPSNENRDHAGFLAVVADGMGGMQFGRESSRLAVQAFLSAYSVKHPTDPIPAALKRSAAAANEAVREMADTKGKAGEAGTTLIAAAIHNNTLYWISVGDSRIYHIGESGLRQLNVEHNLYTKLKQLQKQGCLAGDDIEGNPQKEALTSFIGIEALTEIDVSHEGLSLSLGDSIILCSDGLYKSLTDGEIVDIVRGTSAGQTAEVLTKAAIDKNIPHQDNVTVISLSLREPPPKPATAITRMQPDRKVSFADGAYSWRKPLCTALKYFAGAALAIWLAQYAFLFIFGGSG